MCRYHIIVCFLFYFAIACSSSEQKNPITEQEVLAVETEIRLGGENIDLEQSIKYFQPTPGFTFIQNGVMKNFDEFISTTKSGYESLDSVKYTTEFEQVQIVNDSTAVHTWKGSLFMTTKTGASWNLENFSTTSILIKNNEAIRVTYVHESFEIN